MTGDPTGRLGSWRPAGPGGRPHYLVGWLVLVAVWATWAPLKFRSAWPPIQTTIRWESETVGHFFLLMPFAIVAALYLGAVWHRGVATVVVVAGLVLEIGQGWIQGRSLSPYDVGVGYLGAVLALLVADRMLRRGVRPATLATGLAATTIAVVWALMLHGTVAYNRGLTLAGWSPAFEIAAAEEVGGSRSYEGTVSEARICAGRSLDVCAQTGAGEATRRRLAGAAAASQRVRLEAVVVSRTREQDGPARIVTFSDGPYLRNATLAQRKRNLILRVRTSRGGPNGTAMEFVLEDALREDVPLSVTATFDHGTVRMSAVGEGHRVVRTYRPPFVNGLRTQGLGRPRVPQPLTGRAPLLGTVAQFLGLGLALGYVVRRAGLRIAMAVVLALASLAWLDRALGQTIDPGLPDRVLVAASAAVGAFSRRGRFALAAGD